MLGDSRVGDYVERGRGQIYWKSTDSRGPSPLELTRLAVSQYSELFYRPIRMLDNVDESSLLEIIDSVPEDWMTPLARRFAFELMRYSCGQLREAI